MTTPSLATHVRRALEVTNTEPGARLMVACSGGLDSQVLLDVLAHVARDRRIAVVAHGVDHGLRAEAKDELLHAARLAQERGVAFDVTHVRVAPGSNLQARARDLRYQALTAAAQAANCSRVATGHHLDDRAETVLIRILRGAPLAGLAVLPLQSQDRLRPLLAARRSELVSHAEKKSLDHALDPSNLDRKYLRVRVRLDIMPMLRALDPRIEEHLARLADDAIRYAPSAASPLSRVSPASFTVEATSARAVSALRDAAIMRNARARVQLAEGKTGRWDALEGIVISSPASGGSLEQDAPRQTRSNHRRAGRG